MGHKHWTPPEIEYLLSLANDYHIKEVTRHYNRWATINKYQSRSCQSVKSKLIKSGFSTKPQGLWVTLMDAARALDRSNQSIRLWIKKGWIGQQHIKRPTPHSTVIHRKAFDLLAEEKPSLFAGCSLESLLKVFHSEVFAEKIYESFGDGFHASRPKPVQCIETGKRYPSIEAAAKENYISPGSIRRAVKLGSKTIVGRWRVISRKVY